MTRRERSTTACIYRFDDFVFAVFVRFGLTINATLPVYVNFQLIAEFGFPGVTMDRVATE